MNIRSVARTFTTIAASSALLIVSEGAAWAQHAGGGGGGFHGGGGGGFHGGAAVHGGGFHGGYGYHGYGYGYRGGYGYGWHGGYGWGWRPGLGWWWWGWGVPLGVYLSVLPWSYSTLWWGGVPYYYANGDYYVWNGTASQYEEVQPPAEVTQQGPGAPPVSQELYAYPMHGQSDEQQSRDKRECREWAGGQVSGSASAPNGPPNYPPNAPPGSGAPGAAPGTAAPPAGPAPPASASGGQDYLRAEAACLEARGYSVK